MLNSNAFSSTGITSSAGSIFVNASLVDAYKSATNWTYFSNRIFAYTPSLITFTIHDTEYQAEEGMTWGEWVDSEYSNENFSNNNNSRIWCAKNGTPYTLYDSSYVMVNPNSLILDAGTYILIIDAPSGY